LSFILWVGEDEVVYGCVACEANRALLEFGSTYFVEVAVEGEITGTKLD